MAKNARVFERVVKEIAASIHSGELPESAMLPSERDLAEKYGVSRVSVREALLSLQTSGLIRMRDRARAQVMRLESTNLLNPLAGTAQSLLSRPGGVSDFQEARILLECGLARHAARYASPKEIERLGQALLANRRAIGDQDSFVTTDLAFHTVLAEIPQNDIFIALNAALGGWLLEQRRISVRARGAERRAYQHHEAIFEAIAKHDPEAADRAMSSHLTVGARIIRSLQH